MEAQKLLDRLQNLQSRLDPVYDYISQRLNQNPITSMAVIIGVVTIVLLVWLLQPDPSMSEEPLVHCRRVRLWGAVFNIWSVRMPHRRLADALRRKQSWLIMTLQHKSEMVWIVGGTGVGKSKRIIIQMIVTLLLRRKKSLLANDPSGELMRFSWPFLAKAGGYPAVHIFSTDPNHPNEICSAIDVARDQESLERFIQGGLYTLNMNDQSWTTGAKNLWISVWRAEGCPDLPTTFDSMNPSRLDQLAEQYPQTVGAQWRGSEMRGGHNDTLRIALSPFTALEKDNVRRLFSRGRAGKFVGPLFREREAVYLVSKDGDNSADGIFAALTAELQERAKARPEGSPRVEMYVDEAGTRYPIANANDYLNTIRKYGVNALLAVQSVAQLRSKMGHDEADDALGTARLVVVGAQNDRQTRDFFSDLGGTKMVARYNSTRFDRLISEFTSNRIERPERRRENRIRDEHITELREGEVFVFPKPGKPYLARQKAYWNSGLYAPLVRPRKKNQRGVRIQTSANQTRQAVEDAGETAQVEPQPAEPPEASPPEPQADTQPPKQTDEDQGAATQRERARAILEDTVAEVQREYRVQLSYAPEVADEMVRRAKNPGELEAVIEAEIARKIPKLISAGHLESGDAVQIGVKQEGQLSLRKEGRT